MKAGLVICLLVVLILAAFGRVEALEETEPKTEQQLEETEERGRENLVTPDQVMFGRKMYRCAMYSDKCFIDVFIRNDTKLKDLIFKSSNDEMFKVEWVRRCKFQAGKKVNRTCATKESFFVRPQVDSANSSSTEEEELDLNKVYGRVYSIKIEPVVFGKAKLYVLKYLEDDIEDAYGTTNETLFIDMLITQPRRFVDEFLDVWVYIFQTFISLTMGVLIDTGALLKIIKIPLPVIFGTCCQYIMMPLITLAYIFIFSLSPLESLTLFIYGCSPGGAASNNWTIMFDGDIDLSAILTFVSTLAALGMLPAWTYTIGTIFMKQANIRIPFVNMLKNLGIAIGPCIFGVILSYFVPKTKVIFARIAKPMTLFVLLSFLALILYSKWYIFGLFTLKHWIVGPLIPTTGFFASFLLAFICRFKIKQAKTISIETGIQNVGVAFIIILSTFPSPESDYAVLPLISVALMTNVPLYSVYFAYRLFKNRQKAMELKKKKAYELAAAEEQRGEGDDDSTGENADELDKIEKEDLIIVKF